jgi:hypothetical protein
MAEREIEAPPPGEQIHMPRPSIIPMLNAVGLTIAIVGVTSSRWMIIAGAVLFLVTTAVWIRDVARDIEELPAEHH